MSTQPSLSVIIPFRNHGAMTARAVRSLALLPVTAEIIAVDNGSDPFERKAVEEALRELCVTHEVRLVRDPSPFNFQRINNDAARLCSGECLLFMNNDAYLVASSTRLVASMLRLAREADLGALGATLLFSDEERIQHGGVELLPGSFASHILLDQKFRDHQSLPSARVTAVTAAFLMVETTKFWAVSGFDERFIVCGGDVDLCIRLELAGFGSVICRDGYAVHDESSTRDPSKIPASDFVESYHSYIRGFDPVKGDRFVSQAFPYGIPLAIYDAVSS